MADDFYDYKLAIDPLTGNIVPGATAAVYTVEDTAHSTPLAITDLQGVPLPGNQITAGPTGIYPPFRVVSGTKRVVAVDVSSGAVTPMSSEVGRQGEPGGPGQPGPPWTPGAHQQNVTGSTVLTVTTEHMYELTATAGAAVTLDGGPGTQVAVKWLGAAGTLQGVAMDPGAVAVAACWPTGGWAIYLIGSPGDTTAPTPGTIAGSAISSSGFTLTISGASDAGGLHAQPYAFSTDNGATWSAYQSSASLAIIGKSALTGYPCVGKVRDAAGNTATTPAVTVTTTAAGATWQTIAQDSFNGTDGTALTAHTSETGGVTYTSSQAGPKLLSNKVDIYPYGGDQNAASSFTTGLGATFRTSIDYAIPATHGDTYGTSQGVSLLVRGGLSAASGAGNFHVKIGVTLPTANSTYGTMTGTTTYDGALTLTAVGGKNLAQVPLAAKLGISLAAGVLSVLVDGVVWATVSPPSGCTFGDVAGWAMEPAGLYNGPHWSADNYLVEKYA